MRILQERPTDGIIDVHLEVSIFQLDPDLLPCDEQFKIQDCLATRRKSLNTSCFLPFETEKFHDKTICKTDRDGYNTMILLAKLKNMCSSNCLITDIHVKEIPSTYLTVKSQQIFLQGLKQAMKMKPGYYFDIPTKARQITTSHEYGFISWVAEFAGWSGIFVGLSLLSVMAKFLDLKHHSVCLESRKRIIVNTARFACSVYILHLLYFCCTNFLKEPIAMNVEFEETKTDFDFTICAPKYPFAFKRGSITGKILFRKTFLHSSMFFISHTTFSDHIKYKDNFL